MNVVRPAILLDAVQLGFRLTIFGLALLASFVLAWLLRRYGIRV